MLGGLNAHEAGAGRAGFFWACRSTPFQTQSGNGFQKLRVVTV